MFSYQELTFILSARFRHFADIILMNNYNIENINFVLKKPYVVSCYDSATLFKDFNVHHFGIIIKDKQYKIVLLDNFGKVQSIENMDFPKGEKYFSNFHDLLRELEYLTSENLENFYEEVMDVNYADVSRLSYELPTLIC